MAEANPCHIRSERVLYPIGDKTGEGELTRQGARRANRDNGHVEPIIPPESSAYRHHSGSSSENAPISNMDELSTQPLVIRHLKPTKDEQISTSLSNPAKLTTLLLITRHTRNHVLRSEAEATEAGPSHNNTDCRDPSSANRIFDIFAGYEKEFGKSLTTRDTQKPRPRFAAERHLEPVAGGTTVTGGKRDKAWQSQDSLLTQNHRPKKRRMRFPTFDSDRGAKRPRFS
jgi:hypothetical protein